jgi:ion channel-forming bestrophin family protein
VHRPYGRTLSIQYSLNPQTQAAPILYFYPMVYYNPKDWFKPLFEFHKADTFRKLMPLLLIIGLFTFGIGYLETRYLKLSADSYVKNIPIMHSLLGFAISMLLVFRTNSAYDRWWEGRKLWGGLVNNCRNLAVKIDALLPNEDLKNRHFYSRLITLFPHELKLHLQQPGLVVALDDEPHPDIPSIDRKRHIPMQISKLLMHRTNDLCRQGVISGEQLITLNAELQAFLEITGACERIKNTPLPYTYSSFIKKFIAIYVLTLPFGFAFTLGFIAIPVVMFIFYVLASLELIAEEIEDPFGTDSNDLPMTRLAETIKRNVQETLGP